MKRILQIFYLSLLLCGMLTHDIYLELNAIGLIINSIFIVLLDIEKQLKENEK